MADLREAAVQLTGETAERFNHVLETLAALPAGSNPYTYLSEQGLPFLFTVPTLAWSVDVLYTLQAIYAFITVILIVGLVVRWRRKNLAFVRKMVLPGGTLICLQGTNGFFAQFAIFTIGAQASLWATTKLMKIELNPTSQNVSESLSLSIAFFVFVILISASWNEAAGLLASCVTTHFRVNGRLPRYVHVRALNIAIIAVPSILVATWLGVFVAYGISCRQGDDAVSATLAAASAQEAAWTGGATLTALLTLQQPLDAALDRFSHAAKLLQVALAVLASYTLVLLCVVIPTSFLQVQMLLRQIRFLHETKKICTIDIGVPSRGTVASIGSAPDPDQTKSRISILGRLKERVSRESREDIDIGKQTDKLKNLCWQRIVVTCVFTASIIPYIAVTLAGAICLRNGFNLSAGVNILLELGPYLSGAVTGLPLGLWFLVRSFDKSGAQRGSDLHSNSSGGPQSPKSPGRHANPSFALDSIVEKPEAGVVSPTFRPLDVRVEVERVIAVDVDESLV